MAQSKTTTNKPAADQPTAAEAKAAEAKTGSTSTKAASTSKSADASSSGSKASTASSKSDDDSSSTGKASQASSDSQDDSTRDATTLAASDADGPTSRTWLDSDEDARNSLFVDRPEMGVQASPEVLATVSAAIVPDPTEPYELSDEQRELVEKRDFVDNEDSYVPLEDQEPPVTAGVDDVPVFNPDWPNRHTDDQGLPNKVVRTD